VREANIHCITNDALYGKVNHQPATVVAGDILPFQDFNLADMWFRNAGAAANTTIYIVGITMSKKRMEEMGILNGI
jgi:hypothetical protein